MNPADTILRLAEIIARYESTFQADKAAIAQRDETIRSQAERITELEAAAARPRARKPAAK